MKLRSAGDSLGGSPQPFDHRMPPSLWAAWAACSGAPDPSAPSDGSRRRPSSGAPVPSLRRSAGARCRHAA